MSLKEMTSIARLNGAEISQPGQKMAQILFVCQLWYLSPRHLLGGMDVSTGLSEEACFHVMKVLFGYKNAPDLRFLVFSLHVRTRLRTIG